MKRIDTPNGKAEKLLKDASSAAIDAGKKLHEHDLNKLTPKGAALNEVARRESKEMFRETGDEDWLEAGKIVATRMGKKQKPAPAFKTK